ncbi:unnamed protein product [Xylocopa violacea]|uniref:Uncharacterized protein n=1 Tax=Xylocopa violacea TaxID=135666 RepID=A0ABP1N2U3_XYLVO
MALTTGAGLGGGPWLLVEGLGRWWRTMAAGGGSWTMVEDHGYWWRVLDDETIHQRCCCCLEEVVRYVVEVWKQSSEMLSKLGGSTGDLEAVIRMEVVVDESMVEVIVKNP